MKNLFLLLVLPLILVGGVIGNAIYINEVSDRLLEQLDALPAPDSPTVTEPLLELCAVWEKHCEYVGLTTSSLLTDRVSEQTAALLAAARAGDAYGYAAAQALLRTAIEHLRRQETLTPTSFW